MRYSKLDFTLIWQNTSVFIFQLDVYFKEVSIIAETISVGYMQ